MTLNVMNTWRVTRPIERDAVVVHIIRYEWWDTEEEEQGRQNRNFVLSLDPEPHWEQFDSGNSIEPTLEFSGLDMFRMGYRGPSAEFDLCKVAEDKINDMITDALSHVVDLKPPVEFSG